MPYRALKRVHQSVAVVVRHELRMDDVIVAGAYCLYVADGFDAAVDCYVVAYFGDAFDCSAVAAKTWTKHLAELVERDVVLNIYERYYLTISNIYIKFIKFTKMVLLRLLCVNLHVFAK